MTAGDLRRGSRVLSDHGITTVEAVVQIRYHGALYEVQGMKLTAYHPVLLDGVPAFPCEIGRLVTSHFNGYVYDVVLANRGILASPVMLTHGVSASALPMYVATWGHTCQLDKFQHDYFGSEHIVQDLRTLYGDANGNWPSDRVVIEAPCFVRDAQTGLVVQLQVSAASAAVEC